MKDIEIVVFNDKSWVRLTEYQKVKEENEQLQQKWLESEYEKSKLVSQIEKMKCCRNCKYWNVPDDVFNTPCEECDVCKDFNKWELAE